MSWNFDAAHSHIQFSVRHMMVSRVRGQFDEWSGEIKVDEDNPSATDLSVQLDVASINTKQSDRDGHLRSPDFFDVENYPHITFRSTNVEMIDRKHAKLTGDLTIRGVTKPVTLDVVYEGQYKNPMGAFNTAGFSASTKINRKDWGLEWNVALETGGVLVADEVTIDIEVELMKALEETAQAEAVPA